MTTIRYNIAEVPEIYKGLVRLGFIRLAGYGFFNIEQVSDATPADDLVRVVFTDDLRQYYKWISPGNRAISFSRDWGHPHNLIVVKDSPTWDAHKLVHTTMHEGSHLALNHPSHVYRRTSILWPWINRRQSLDAGDVEMYEAKFGRRPAGAFRP